MHYIYTCWIIFLYVFLICVHCFLLGTIFTRNIKSKFKSNISTLVLSSSSNVGDCTINLKKDYEETPNKKGTGQGSTIEKDRLGIL